MMVGARGGAYIGLIGGYMGMRYGSVVSVGGINGNDLILWLCFGVRVRV